jgi:hypothetical protein
LLPAMTSQPKLATPLIVSSPLFSRCVDVENLLHREGYLTGVAFPFSSPASLQDVLSAMGHEGVEGLASTSALVIPLSGRRCIRTGAHLEMPPCAELAACMRRTAELLLGGTLAPQHPHCLLVPTNQRCQRASASLFAELVAPAPPPKLPVCKTLASLSAQRPGSRQAAPPPPSAAGGGGASPAAAPAKGGQLFVPLDEVLGFVFPPGALHPRSMGRLILYALQGPLRDGSLVGGRLSLARPLTEREVESEIDALEEEDVLAAYTGGSVLGGTEDVLRSVRLDGNLHMPRMSKEQVEALLAPVERRAGAPAAAHWLLPPSPCLSFHSLQRAVLLAREKRVADLKRAYPPAILPAEAPSRLLPQPPILGRNTLLPKLQASLVPLEEATGASRRGPQTSKEAWQKMSQIARGRKVDDLLHTRLQQVAHIWGTNTSAEIGALIANTQLIRDSTALKGRADWVGDSVFAHLPHRGSYVPSTRDVSMSLPLKRLDRT